MHDNGETQAKKPHETPNIHIVHVFAMRIFIVTAFFVKPFGSHREKQRRSRWPRHPQRRILIKPTEHPKQERQPRV